MNNEYRVTINRRDKIYELLNVLEGEIETKRNESISPHFYEDKSDLAFSMKLSDLTNAEKPSFNAHTVEENAFLNPFNRKQGKGGVDDFPKSSPPSKSEIKTNLVNLDTSRDQEFYHKLDSRVLVNRLQEQNKENLRD